MGQVQPKWGNKTLKLVIKIHSRMVFKIKNKWCWAWGQRMIKIWMWSLRNLEESFVEDAVEITCELVENVKMNQWNHLNNALEKEKNKVKKLPSHFFISRQIYYLIIFGHFSAKKLIDHFCSFFFVSQQRNWLVIYFHFLFLGKEVDWSYLVISRQSSWLIIFGLFISRQRSCLVIFITWQCWSLYLKYNTPDN